MEPIAPKPYFVSRLLIFNASVLILRAQAHVDVHHHMCGIRQLKHVIIAQMATQAQAPFAVCIKSFDFLKLKFQYN